MRIKSIRYFFVISILVVLACSALVIAPVQMVLSGAHAQRDIHTRMSIVADTVAAGVKSGEISVEAAEQRSLENLALVSRSDIILVDMLGRVMYCAGGYHRMARGTPLPEGLARRLRERGVYDLAGKGEGLFSTEHYIDSRALVDPGGGMRGYVLAAITTPDADGYILRVTLIVGASALLVLGLSGGLAVLLYRRAESPLRRVSMAARRFGAGDYTARVPVEGDDELARLALAFNEMAASLETTDNSRRMFMGGIAHELRTPMTSIKGFIDGMLDGTIPEERRSHYLAVVGEEVGRLARLIRNMLDIARLEAGEFEPDIVSFDIRPLICEIAVGQETRLTGKGLSVAGLEGAAVYVMADRDFVYQVLYNLVDNAIKFSAEGTEITVTVQREREGVAVRVRNRGPGIPAEFVSSVFDRFYKADKSRGEDRGSAGLGLHLSRVLAGRMGGQIWAESAEGEWAEFVLLLRAGSTRPRGPKRE